MKNIIRWIVFLLIAFGMPFLATAAGSAIDSISLTTLDTHTILAPLSNGTVVPISSLGDKPLTLVVQTTPSPVGSIKLEFLDSSGDIIANRVDNDAPYTLFGEINGLATPWFAHPGTYTLIATPYTKPHAQGEAGTSKTLTFKLTNALSPAKTAADFSFQAEIATIFGAFASFFGNH